MKRYLLLPIVLFGLLAAGLPATAQDPPESESDQVKLRRPMFDHWRPGAGREGRRGKGSPVMVSDEQIEQLMTIMREVMPETAERLEQLRRKNPERARAFLSRIAPRLKEMADLKQRDPAEYQRRVAEAHRHLAIVQKVRQYRQAVQENDTAAAEQRKAELRTMIAETFTARQERMARELKMMEQRLAQLRQELEQRIAQRDRLIDEHLNQILNGKPPRDDDQIDRPGPHPRRGRWEGLPERPAKEDAALPPPAPPPPPPPPTVE